MAGVEKSGGKGFTDAFEEAAGKVLDQASDQQAPVRPSIGHGEGLPPGQIDQVDAAFESLGGIGRTVPGQELPTKAEEGTGNRGNDVVDPAKPSQPPSDQIEGPAKPAEIEPSSVEFPDVPKAPEAPADDLGLSPSEGAEQEHEGMLSDPPEDSRVFDIPGVGQLDEGDLMPPEVQEPTFPDPGEVQVGDPGFDLEPPSDFGAGDEVPADPMEAIEGSVDEGF